MERSCFFQRRLLFAGLFAALCAVGDDNRAQSLATSISGYAEVITGVTPDRRDFNRSTPGDPLTENREVSLSSSLGGISSGINAFANVRATTSIAFGSLRSSLLTAAGYSQFFYIPGPAPDSLVLAPPITNYYTPLAYAQAIAQSEDRLTITSSSAPPATPVSFVFSLSLDAPREITYSAQGFQRGVNDATTPLYPYTGSQFAGSYTPREPYADMVTRVSLVITDEENPGAPLVAKVLSSRVNFWHFRTITSEVPVTLIVGKIYRVEVRLDTSNRSDGGMRFQPDTIYPGELDWNQDPNRLENRRLSLAVSAFASLVISPADATTDFTSASGARYDGSVVNPPVDSGKTPPPKLFVRTGKRQQTNETSQLIVGSATGAVTRVGVRVGPTGPFRTAKGLRNWRFTARLDPGINRIAVRAEGPGGNSRLFRMVVDRR